MSEEKKTDDVQIISYMDDWILSDVFDDPFYDFNWWIDAGKSKMKPLVKRSSLVKEMVLKAAEIAIASFYFGYEPMEQKKRIKFIVGRSMDEGVDEKYEKSKFLMGDVRLTEEEYNKLYRQSNKRLFKLIEGLDELDDGDDPDYKERAVVRNQAFEAAYLCLRTEEPEETFYILWGLIDLYYGAIKQVADE